MIFGNKNWLHWPTTAWAPSSSVSAPRDSRPCLCGPQNHLAQPLRVEELAKKARMSPRSFARHFLRQNGTTPHQWLIHQRLLAAQRMLEKTDESVDRIAEAVGLQTAATLRLHFSRVLGTSPTAYRKHFSMRAGKAFLLNDRLDKFAGQ